ncbi:NAD(P)/FAD-dependent oxidoreductase [Aquimarina sp. 2201CG14-23]|uniref:NAD(P)/FAD-dependent oxidoreductase n=1 Tax=Aquimarina mycalae TaxID=3040073 RepID=UPI002477FCB5|nr:FAD-dependent oxidoreductase [Aquimarina sp. 2201CG14-23]MDH7447866.1 FAD-dependent oxidoreductase [Aquimarina sp. 2201CG14-23]
MIDYIIVGFGLAGLSFVEELENNNKSYKVYEDNSQQSSRVAGGLYNPVILKRFTAAWLASEQLRVAVPFYKNIEAKLGISVVHKLPVLRRFNGVEEQNLWFEACDKPILSTFLSSELIRNKNQALDIPFHYGKVNNTGRIEVEKMLTSYSDYIEKKGCLIKESFEHNNLIIDSDYIEYNGIKARNIVFSEGFGVKNNPFFNQLPLQGNKGEYLIIKSKELKLDEAVKSSIFIIPLGDDLYKVGATYNNQDKTATTTDVAKEQIERKLEQFLKVTYEIVDQVAGIRPTTKDRRPLVGTHTEYKNLHIINGLGSRGILIGPFVAQKLYNQIEKTSLLEREIDIRRF